MAKAKKAKLGTISRNGWRYYLCGTCDEYKRPKAFSLSTHGFYHACDKCLGFGCDELSYPWTRPFTQLAREEK